MIYGYAFQRGVHETLKRLSLGDREKYFSTKEVLSAFRDGLEEETKPFVSLNSQSSIYTRTGVFLKKLVSMDEAIEKKVLHDNKNYIIFKFRYKE